MNRKPDCEQIILTAQEKKLLNDIKRHPHKTLDWNTARPLCQMNLIVEDIKGHDNLGQCIGAGTYCVSDFYSVYRAYKSDLRRMLTLQSFWLPILVSLLTNLAVNALLPLLR